MMEIETKNLYLDRDGKPTTDPEGVKEVKTRAVAGKALAVFLAVMVALTWAGSMLEEMTIATVTTTSTQRGALEIQIDGSTTLSAAQSVPIVAEESARVLSLFVSAGSLVSPGDALFTVDVTDALAEAHKAMISAEDTLLQKQRALDWSAADLGMVALSRLIDRQAQVTALSVAVAEAEAALTVAQEAETAARAQLAMLAPEQGQQAEAAQAASTQTPSLADITETYAQSQAATQAAFTALEVIKASYQAEKNRLNGDTSVRDYLGKLDELTSAEESCADARDTFVDAMRKIEGGNPEATLSQALAAYDAKASYKKTYVSPVTGSVTSQSLSIGGMAGTSAPSLMLSDQGGGLSLSFQVTEDEAAYMAVGNNADITVGSAVYTAAIQTIAASTENPGAFDVTFLLPGDAGTAGMSATVKYRKRTQNYDVLIPLSALRSDSDGDFVYVVEQQESSLGAKMSVRRIDVSVLEQDSSRAALQGGVSQRDTLVTRSDRSLADGDLVRLED